MVDQATLNGDRPQAPTAGMRRSMKEFTADLAELTELQMRLYLADIRESQCRITVSVLALAIGLVMALGCVPVALATLALFLMSTAEFSAVTASLTALTTGTSIAILLLLIASVEVRKSVRQFKRSNAEFKRNFRWLKKTLRHPT